MNSEDQASGEKRVKSTLIEPLQRLGLTRPTTLNAAKFQDMLNELAQRLAYLSEENLLALSDWVQANPGGPNGDRFPIALKILAEARKVQQPDGGPSPLIRSVFGNALGQEALAAGWAPELLLNLRKFRKWPGGFTVSQIRDSAHDALRRLEDIEMRLTRGREVSPDDAAWRHKRRAQLQKCQDIADLVKTGSGK